MTAARDEADPTGSGLVQGWFAVTNPEPGVYTIEEPLHDQEVKSSLVVGTERALLIDTGMGVGNIRALVESLTDRPITVVNSHAHWDHVGGNHLFQDGATEIWIHAAERAALEAGVAANVLTWWFGPDQLRGPLPPGFDPAGFSIPPGHPTGTLHGGETFDLGGRVLEVIHAPGHSPGGIVLLDRAGGVLFSTDLAYPDSLYAFDEEADFPAYRRTLSLLADLAPDLRVVYPSHGRSPMDPALLPKMRDALDEIAAGRPPDAVADDRVRHDFDGFAILAPPPAEGTGG
jgi:glyoxylase-like metal-dependent hydrolase (beta-lactamase superfamily II)